MGHQLREQDLGHTQAQYDSRQKLLDYLSGISSAYARADYDRQRQLATGAGQAAGNYQAPPQSPGATDFTPPSVQGSTYDPTPANPDYYNPWDAVRGGRGDWV